MPTKEILLEKISEIIVQSYPIENLKRDQDRFSIKGVIKLKDNLRPMPYSQSWEKLEMSSHTFNDLSANQIKKIAGVIWDKISELMYLSDIKCLSISKKYYGELEVTIIDKVGSVFLSQIVRERLSSIR